MGEEKETERDKKPTWQSVWEETKMNSATDIKHKQDSHCGLAMKFHDFL